MTAEEMSIIMNGLQGTVTIILVFLFLMFLMWMIIPHLMRRFLGGRNDDTNADNKVKKRR
jgi:Na+/proline symporter